MKPIYIKRKEGRAIHSKDFGNGIIFDYDAKGIIVGIEVLEAVEITRDGVKI